MLRRHLFFAGMLWVHLESFGRTVFPPVQFQRLVQSTPGSNEAVWVACGGLAPC